MTGISANALRKLERPCNAVSGRYRGGANFREAAYQWGMPQPVGPDACGHVAHAPEAGCAGGPDFTETANTDRHFSRSSPPHCGHRGNSPPRISSSNRFPHRLHSYSNNGMDDSQGITA